MPASVPSADPLPRHGKSNQQGFALLIMLIIVVMGSLYAVTSQLEVATRKYARDEATLKALAMAKEALIGYAATYRDDPTHSTEVFGYLPCPSTYVGANPALWGTADSSCAAGAIGLLPYKTLGLPDLRDADGNCLWYAVSGSFKNSAKVPQLNWDTQGQFTIDGANVAPEQGDGGAAAVIISPGSALTAHATNANGPCQVDPGPSGVSTYIESYNSATSTFTPGVSGTANNDLLAWITPKDIFDKVVKRQDFSNPLSATPPGQVNKLTDEIKAVLEKNIQDDLVAGSTTISQPITTGYDQFAGKLIGKLPAPMSLYDPTYDNYFDNWSEQYRQVMCASLTTPCLTLAGTTCRGALMFGGRTATGQNSTSITAGQPRPSTWKTPSTANLAYYFDPGGGLDILNSATPTFSGNASYAATTPSADVGTCLFPGTFVSFAQDIAAFSTGKVLSSVTSPVASVTTSGTPSINLGSSTTVSRSGCVWYPTSFALESNLRLYFKFRINTGSTGSGPGFTLTLADAATNSVASANPIMCGSASGTRLGYAGTPPSGSSAGIKPPKLGLEFDTSINSSRNDPSTDHFAFLYWGKAGDNSPTGSGDDDNTHYNGILGSGSEPANPGALSLTAATATPIATLATASWASGTVSATSAAPHGFATGQYVLISDVVTATGFDPGTSPVPVTVTDATHFTYALGSSPGSYTYGTTASRTADTTDASWSGGSVTVTTVNNHGFSAGQFVNISGVRPAGYNGTYQIASIPGAQTFTYSLASNPGSYSVDGYVTATNQVASAAWASGTVTVTTSANHGLALRKQVTGASWSGITNLTTITTASNHGYAVGQAVNIAGIFPASYNGSYPIVSIPNATSFTFAPTTDPGSYVSGGWVSAGDMVNISGISPAGYNGSYAVSATDATHFTYAVATDPGGSFAGATFATPGIATVKSPYFPAGGLMPLASDIHVRLDVSRAYDATAKRATLTLKAYVDNLFPLADNCLSSDFQNLARDLSSFCPLRTPTIEQDNIVINDVSGPALANIYVGFTTARGSASSDNQDISIYNLLMRSQ